MQNAGSGAPEVRGAMLVNADAAMLDVEDIMLTSAEITDDGDADNLSVDEGVATSEQDVPSSPKVPDIQFASLGGLSTPRAATAELGAVPAAECEIAAAARPVAAAMVNLTLTATCLPEERVTVHHAGMLFNQTTDASGGLEINVPALMQEAVFVIAFSNGEGAVAQTTVDELIDFDRVALQWKGDTGFELHAREFGANYGDDGHVWSGAARDITYAVTGQGGYIARLGDAAVPDGLLAEVYTFPASAAQNEGDVALSVEAEVGRKNCGLEIEAQTLQTFSGKDITSRDLTLSVPDCDAAGNFLVLNNLFEDLKVALN
jgi:hypothetical protein